MSCVDSSMFRGFFERDVFAVQQMGDHGCGVVCNSLFYVAAEQLKLKMEFSFGDRSIGAGFEVYSVVANAEVSMVASSSI